MGKPYVRGLDDRTVYFIQSCSGGPIKIGRSRNPSERVKQLEVASGLPLRILGVLDETEIQEEALHRLFGHLRISTSREWFLPEPELLAFIGQVASPPPERQLPKVQVNRSASMADQLRQAFKASGMRASHVARLLGVSPSTVTRFIHGEKDLSLEKASRLSGILGLGWVQPGGPSGA